MNYELIETLCYLGAALVLLLLGKILRDVLTPFDDDAELTAKDNPAYGLSTAGYYLAIPIIFAGAVYGDAPPPADWAVLGTELGIASAYAAVGIVALNICRFILDKAVLPAFSVRKEIVGDRNAGAGAVVFGTYVATACAIAGSISGEGGGPLTAVAFFALAQLSIIVFARIYQLMTPYDLHAEIEKDNVAAGVAFGLNILALGVICGKAAAGDFFSWSDNLIDFGWMVAAGLVLILLVRVVADKVLLPKASLGREISQDQNLAAAMVEGAAAIGGAAILVVLI